MKSQSRKSLADNLARHIKQLKTKDIAEMTGSEAMNAALGIPQVSMVEEQQPVYVEKVTLYLKDGLKGAERNWTKYPNEIHSVVAARLAEMSQALAYMYLWRQSWGYGRNYCRTSYQKIVKDTVIRSRSTAQRAIDGLVEGHFIVKGLLEDGAQDATQEGMLYRILTPKEIEAGKTEEGVSLSDIPPEGVPMVGIPMMGTDVKLQNTAFDNGIPIIGNTDDKYTAVPTRGIPMMGTPDENSNNKGANDGYTDNRYTDNEYPLKEDISKDTLSPRAIIDSFYRSIGQSRIAKEKRERANVVFKELGKDGFSAEEIQYAAIWTIANAKEKPYDFAMLKHTIGQALGTKKQADDEEVKRLAAEQEEAQAQREAEQIQSLKDALSEQERAELRKQAKQEIEKSGKYKPEFQSEQLIEAVESDILQRG